jgi:hypothetical protein
MGGGRTNGRDAAGDMEKNSVRGDLARGFGHGGVSLRRHAGQNGRMRSDCRNFAMTAP